jgi:hypothetical protein
VLYRDEVWTGIEYQVAGHLIWEGMLEEGLAMVRGVHDRYDASKHNPWNEIECGDHYARALASWGVLAALEGYEYHGPRGHLGFAPRISPDDFRAAFTAAEGWGTYRQQRSAETQTSAIEVRWGRLRLKTLALAPPPGNPSPKVAAKVAAKPLAATLREREGAVLIEFAGEVVLKEGETLEVTLG